MHLMPKETLSCNEDLGFLNGVEYCGVSNPDKQMWM
jgi:hypothetical protein